MGTFGDIVTVMTPQISTWSMALAKGIEPAQAARLPVVNGKAVDCNHATFVYGHLSIYPQRLMGLIGAPAGQAAVPASYDGLFEAGKVCRDDADGSIYPPLHEVLGHYADAYATLIEQVKKTDEGVFAKPIEGNDHLVEFFGTVGAMCLFMLHDHRMFHLGQLSTWRRVMGLGSAM